MTIIQDKFRQLEVKRIPLWDRWGERELRSRRNEIGSKAFNRGYRHEAIERDELTFSHFTRIKKYGVGPEIISPSWERYAGVDVSSSSRPGSVIFTGAVSPGGKRYPKEVRIGAWTAPEFVRQMLDCYNRYRHQVILVENNGVQTMLVDWLNEKGAHLPIEGYVTGVQKMDPEIGLPSLDIEFENESWVLPMDVVKGHEGNCGRYSLAGGAMCSWCRFIKEFEAHPQYPTTDVVMATWLFREAVRKYRGAGFIMEQSPIEEGVFEF